MCCWWRFQRCLPWRLRGPNVLTWKRQAWTSSYELYINYHSIILLVYCHHFIRDTQIGVVSRGYGCADPRHPQIYVRVTEIKQWILDNSNGTQDSDCSTEPPSPTTPITTTTMTPTSTTSTTTNTTTNGCRCGVERAEASQNRIVGGTEITPVSSY